MKQNDKMLIGIVIGIVLLVVVALVVTLAKPEPTYQSDETPEGVAHNYILAIQKEDFERAYSYLSPTLDGYPKSVRELEHDVFDNSWRFRLDTDTTITFGETKITGKNAVVDIIESRFYGDSLFDSGQSIYNFDMKLQLENGEWKIIYSGYYFFSCWKDTTGYWCDK